MEFPGGRKDLGASGIGLTPGRRPPSCSRIVLQPPPFPNPNNMFKHLKQDLPASLVVFLVALPLCLGIALASGAPPLAGLIAGILLSLIHISEPTRPY